MITPGRKFSAGNSYRYGFNGKEKDKDISEGGQDYGMRIYDSRLGRFLSVDPLTMGFAMLSPYQFASNTPISAIDIDGKEAEIVVDKKAKEIQVNFKFTYTEATMKTIEGQNLAFGDINNSFDYYYKPTSSGETQATKDASAFSGKSKTELEILLGGKIASGGDGYFNIDFGNSGTYKVFCNLTIDNKLNPKKDITVSELEIHPAVTDDEEAETNETGVHAPIGKNTNAKSFGTLISHEIGHKGGNSDYYKILKDNPFKNRMKQITIVTPEGYHQENTVGELMDRGPTMKIVSEGSIKNMISDALKKAESVKQNKVTLLSGSVNQYIDPRTNEPASSTTPPKIIKKENN